MKYARLVAVALLVCALVILEPNRATARRIDTFNIPKNSRDKRDDKKVTKVDLTSRIEQIERAVDKAQFRAGRPNENSDPKEQVKNILNDAKDKVKSLPGSDSSNLENIGKNLGTVITAVETNMAKLQSNDPLQIAQGVMAIVGSFSSFAGPAGPIISAMLSVAGVILGSLQQQPSMTDIYKGLLQEAFDQKTMSDLEASVKGDVKWLQQAKRLMLPYLDVNCPKDTNDIVFLNGQIKLSDGAQTLGQISSYAEKFISNPKSGRDAIKCVRLYIQLSSMRMLMLEMFAGIIRSCTNNTKFSSGIDGTIAESMDQDKDFVKFLRAPTLQNMVTIANYDPAGEDKDIEQALLSLGLPPESSMELVPGCYRLVTYDDKGTLSPEKTDETAKLDVSKSKSSSYVFKPQGSYWKIYNSENKQLYLSMLKLTCYDGWTQYFSAARCTCAYAAPGGVDAREETCKMEPATKHIHLMKNDYPDGRDKQSPPAEDFHLFRIFKIPSKGLFYIAPKTAPSNYEFITRSLWNTFMGKFTKQTESDSTKHLWNIKPEQRCGKAA